MEFRDSLQWRSKITTHLRFEWLPRPHRLFWSELLIASYMNSRNDHRWIRPETVHMTLTENIRVRHLNLIFSIFFIHTFLLNEKQEILGLLARWRIFFFNCLFHLAANLKKKSIKSEFSRVQNILFNKYIVRSLNLASRYILFERCSQSCNAAFMRGAVF